ncbi:MAG: hypothetical protein P4L10_02605 [Acidobacteriaceae bacterium]|jgi:glucose dehydrogenase|nr:hypothetical protein [Acidobacteriaceae bacterium]
MHCKRLVLCLVVFTLIALPGSLWGQDVPPATTQAQAVAYAHAAEANPLAPEAAQQRKNAMSYMENDHTSHVLLCQSVFQEMNNDNKAHGHDVELQMIISAAAFLYEHPEAASDSKAQNLAGINAALNVYEKFLAADPSTKFSYYEKLLKKRSEGKLEKEIASACSSK